jgi:hypothetical protein
MSADAARPRAGPSGPAANPQRRHLGQPKRQDHRKGGPHGYDGAKKVNGRKTLGQIDYHLFTPWRPAERWLYPPVSEFLADWSKTQQPSFVAIRIVGRQWEPRSHQLRDILTRVAMPYRFYPHDS